MVVNWLFCSLQLFQTRAVKTGFQLRDELVLLERFVGEEFIKPKWKLSIPGSSPRQFQ